MAFVALHAPNRLPIEISTNQFTTMSLNQKHAVATNAVIEKISALRRSKLEQVAAAAIRSSLAAAHAAAACLEEESSEDNTFVHCVRCHEEFDPDNAGPYDCIMDEHDEDNGMIESRGPHGYYFMYPCCHLADGNGPCWTGSHLASWDEARVVTIDRGYTHTMYNEGGYWKDQDVVQTWGKQGNSTVCFECVHGTASCAQCCTCGDVSE